MRLKTLGPATGHDRRVLLRTAFSPPYHLPLCLHAFFVFCSAEGIVSGGCVPTMTLIEGLGTVPLATTINGQMLTSVEPIEAAADAGLITLIGTGAVIVGTINPAK